MIEVPEAIRSYLSEHDIAAAVNGLTTSKQRVPDGLGWNEVEAYYEAAGAAQQVKALYAVTLNRLWQAVWADAVAGLTPATPQEQDTYTLPYTVDECWNLEASGRCFRLAPQRWLWADVGFEGDEATIGTHILGRTGKSLIAALDGFQKADTKDWVYKPMGKLVGDEDPIPALQATARKIVELARGPTNPAA